MKRFYKTVTTEQTDEGWEILLDGKIVKTPKRHVLLAPNEKVAEQVAEEWRAQKENIETDTMPFTRFLNIALDLMPDNRSGIEEELIGYADTDLMLYREDEEAELQKLEDKQWSPLVKWAEKRYDVRFVVTEGVMPVSQSAETLKRLRAAMGKLNNFALTGFAILVQSTGSFILASAVLENHLAAARAAELSQLHETFQAKKWGKDEEMEQKSHALTAEINSASQFVMALQA